MIRFMQMSCGSDCTGPYDVEISKPMTVRQFIDELLTDYQSEWGYVGIYSEGEIFGEPKCEYRYGRLLTSPLPESYLDKQIDFVDGGGGWSRSDFILHLKQKTNVVGAVQSDTPLPTDTDLISREAVLDKWYSTSVRGRTEFDQIIMMLPTAALTRLTIPENPTNGDVIRAMFPNAKVEQGLYGITGVPMICLNLGTRYDCHEMSFVEEWWNAPYREELL